MASIIEETLQRKRIAVQLPVKGIPVAGHTNNIEYCIRQLEACSSKMQDPVLRYIVMRSAWGDREMHHAIMPKRDARNERQQYPRLSCHFYTLDDLLRTRSYIRQGRYKLYNGLIVGFNPDFMSSKN